METVQVLVDEPLYTILLEDDELVISILTSGKPGNLTAEQAKLTARLIGAMPSDELTVVRRPHQAELRWFIADAECRHLFRTLDKPAPDELVRAALAYQESLWFSELKDTLLDEAGGAHDRR